MDGERTAALGVPERHESSGACFLLIFPEVCVQARMP
jgi:hypothetical protein